MINILYKVDLLSNETDSENIFLDNSITNEFHFLQNSFFENHVDNCFQLFVTTFELV